MPTLQEATNALTIASYVHILYAEVGTAWPSLENFQFGNDETYGGFKWLGDTSAENLPEFTVDGGDISSRRTADRKNVRAIREDTTVSGTFNSVALTKDFITATDGAAKWNEETKSFTLSGDSQAKSWALLVLVEDGEYISGLGLYNASVLAGFQTYSLEEFQEVPVSVAVSSDSTGKVREIFTPRKKTAA